MRLIDFTELTATPWKNGGGVTRELACTPAGATFDDFLWRVSIADVNQSGPFSAFPGIDRIITLLDGDGMHLAFDNGATHDLTTPLTPYRFRGEDRLHASLAGTPSQDFNLMLRRDAVDGNVAVWRDACKIDGKHDARLLFCTKGRWEAIAEDGMRYALAPQQTLIAEDTENHVTMRPLQAGSALLSVTIVRKATHDS